jgi:hypothetical protein
MMTYNWKEETRILDFFVQLHPANRGLNHYIEIIIMQRKNLVHKGKVDTEATIRRREVAL